MNLNQHEFFEAQAKIYQDEKYFFEEISNDSEIHKLTGNRGCASEKLLL